MSDQKIPTAQETQRALMALVTDARESHESAERVRVQVEALAARYGVKPSRL